MFRIKYSSNLKGEVNIPASKNATLPIVSANYLIGNKVNLVNKPDIVDVINMEKLYKKTIEISKSYFDLTDPLATKFRASILLIPVGLYQYGKVVFVGTGGCKIGKRSLNTFDDAFLKAGVKITIDDKGYKTYKVIGKPKKNIMLQEFSVTTIEALLIYLAFLKDIDYEISIYQVATEPHVKNLVAFLNNAGANIELGIDHTIKIKPSVISIQKDEFKIISDYIQAGTYFAIGAGADNSEILIKDFDVDDLSSMYNYSKKIGIDFKILDKHTIKVNSFNKKQYRAIKIETRIFPGFATDLQSIFGTLLTQANGVSKIFETLYEGRFSFLYELENLGAKIELLNPHEAIIIGSSKLKGNYVTSRDLRCGGAMILAGIMAKGETFITQEDIILRGYENIIENLKNIGVDIEHV